jgi:hypothetical protein
MNSNGAFQRVFLFAKLKIVKNNKLEHFLGALKIIFLVFLFLVFKIEINKN